MPQKVGSTSPQGSQGILQGNEVQYYFLSTSSQTHLADTQPQPINFLSLLHPSSTPPYHLFVSRIIKFSDQQASIFLQQKLKIADAGERAKIIDAICAKGFEMMAHRYFHLCMMLGADRPNSLCPAMFDRFGNWAVQRCLEAASCIDERRKIVQCMRCV